MTTPVIYNESNNGSLPEPITIKLPKHSSIIYDLEGDGKYLME